MLYFAFSSCTINHHTAWCRDGLVVSVSASHAVGCGFVYRLGHIKDHHEKWLARSHKGMSLSVQPACLKGQVVYGMVYGDIHFKDLLGAIARVGYCIKCNLVYRITIWI